MTNLTNIPLVFITEDQSEGTCALCREKVSPHLRFIYDLQDEEVGSIADLEIELCKDCADKHFKKWREYIDKDTLSFTITKEQGQKFLNKLLHKE